jgi:hypothetical protein
MTRSRGASEMARNRGSRKFRIFALTNTRTDAAGTIVCTLCSQMIGRGFDAETIIDAVFAHRSQHVDELNAFVEKPVVKTCSENHDEIIEKHRGQHAIVCRNCGQIIWKPSGWIDPEKLDELDRYFLHTRFIRSGTASPKVGQRVRFEVRPEIPRKEGQFPSAFRADIIVIPVSQSEMGGAQ